MWEEARAQVAATFFKDVVEIYENGLVENEIGEEIAQPVSLGQFSCNIENGPSGKKEEMLGLSIPQSLRISLAKTVPLDYDKTYRIKIKSARINFKDEWLKVDGWTEGQISIVVSASREVAI